LVGRLEESRRRLVFSSQKKTEILGTFVRKTEVRRMERPKGGRERNQGRGKKGESTGKPKDSSKNTRGSLEDCAH